MDQQGQTSSTRTESVHQPLQHWSSTHFQSPDVYDVLSISSLVPSTVHTILPEYTPSTYKNIYPELPSLSEVASEPQLPTTPSPSFGSWEAHDPTTLTSALPCSNNQQRETSDGPRLEGGQVDLSVPEVLPDKTPGTVFIVLTRPGQTHSQGPKCCLKLKCFVMHILIWQTNIGLNVWVQGGRCSKSHSFLCVSSLMTR